MDHKRIRTAAMPKLLICHIPGADLRDVSADRCPHLAGMLGTFPQARFRAQPTTEQLATLLTGTWPHQHGLWGPRLRPDWNRRRLADRLIDLLPDAMTTAAQSCWDLVQGRVDLAGMPPRRRRRFDPCRFNVERAGDTSKLLRPVNGLASIFTAVGAWQGRYVHHDAGEQLENLLVAVGNGEYALELVAIRDLEQVQRWHGLDEARVAQCYRAVDAFLAGLHAKCERHGVTLAVISDHGKEPVHEVVDLRRHLRSLGLRSEDYEIFLESTKATFWFHDADTALAVREYFTPCAFGRFLGREELSSYGLCFEDRSYGDAFFCANAGVAFCPNDIHSVLDNAMRALFDRQARARLRIRRPQADHGYLSEHESAIGFLLVGARRSRTTGRVGRADRRRSLPAPSDRLPGAAHHVEAGHLPAASPGAARTCRPCEVHHAEKARRRARPGPRRRARGGLRGLLHVASRSAGAGPPSTDHVRATSGRSRPHAGGCVVGTEGRPGIVRPGGCA